MGVLYHQDNMTYKYFRYYFFISVDEQVDKYLITDDFNLFKINELQSIYFILDLLNIFDNLCMYKIGLQDSKLLFAIDDKENKRWRFRLDDIDRFIYIMDGASKKDSKCTKNGNLYENYEFLIKIIDELSKIIENQLILNLFKDLMEFAEGLRVSKHQFYVRMLIIKVEKWIDNNISNN